MMLNMEKCTVMNFGFRNREEDYALYDVPLICQDLQVVKQCFKSRIKW